MKSQKQLLGMVDELNKLETEYRKYDYETKRPASSDELRQFLLHGFKIGWKAFELRSAIELDIAKEGISNIRTDDESLRRTLVKIKGGGKFYSISDYENLCKVINTHIEDESEKLSTTTDQFLEEQFDELHPEFLGLFDPVDYYARAGRIGAIVHTQDVPRDLGTYFTEIRDAYALGLLLSSVALCRALLEMCLYDRLSYVGVIKKTNQSNVVIFADREKRIRDIYTASLLKKAKAAGLLDITEYELGHKVNDKANDILHPKDRTLNLEDTEVVKIIEDAVKVVEGLYQEKC